MERYIQDELWKYSCTIGDPLGGVYVASFPALRRGEPGYILSRAWRQGRHDLITRGGAHACSSTSIFKTITVFLSDLVHYLHFAVNDVVHAELVDFLSQCRTITTPHTTNSGTKFVAFQPVRCRVWHSKNLLYRLRFMASINQWFMCNRSYSCTSLDHELRTTWAISCVSTRPYESA